MNSIFQYLGGDYCWFLNSQDIQDPELPLVKSRAHGGTLMLWRKEFDPFIEVISTNTTSFLPVIFKKPGLVTTAHITLYMPTHGKESEFVADLAELRNCLDELNHRFSKPILYIRGDGNINPNNTARAALLQQILRDYSLTRTYIGHTTYHHFVGDGMYDSNIDLLLHTSEDNISESVSTIVCKNENPAILSHHDVILSDFSVPTQAVTYTSALHNIAPRVEHARSKIFWSEEGKQEYCELVEPHLREAREKWLDPDSQMSMSVLLSLTNEILTKCATITNEYKIISTKKMTKARRTPKPIQLASNKMAKAHKALKLNKMTGDTQKLHEKFMATRRKYRQVVRSYRLKDAMHQYSQLDNIFLKPSSAYAYIRSCKSTKARQIEQLTVGEECYMGSAVCDGFYKSMTAIKQCNIEQLRSDSNLSGQFVNYDSLLKLCQGKQAIPPITIEKSYKILQSLRKNVSDYYSITTLHYLYAGKEGIRHYNSLLNGLIAEVNNAKIEELNVAHGNILYKGHRKDRTSDRSYRTISTCPFLAKSVDCYLRDLYHDCWDSCQASTQYQGTGSSHELASLLVTEVILYSLNVSNKPVFILALDAQSAFDRCLRQVLCSELYKAGVSESAILYMDNRLASRKTIYEWDGVKMGPSEDMTGFEQGGMNSSDYYKLYNNEQLTVAQASALGADIGSGVISAVGQADDVILMSNDIYNLKLLVKLTEEYCKKYRVLLEPKKTKLLGFCNRKTEVLLKLAKGSNMVAINGVDVTFSSEAEHVGVLRSTDGNMPSILRRVAEHKKSLGAVLSAGLARGHRGSPAAALRVHQLHCTPVLFSGLASLCLNKAEINVIDKHYQYTMQNLQRLHKKTPRSIVYFLAGSLPGEAILHMRQLSLLSMICHLPGDPLHQHAQHVLTAYSSGSWFHQVRDLCQQYKLSHPLTLLGDPVPKLRFKKIVKLRVVEYWQNKLAAECSSPDLPSLQHFNPYKSSLLHPHPIWTTSAGSCFETAKSTVLARMVSGRYRTEMMCRFWTTNRGGFCLSSTCLGQNVLGTLQHLLIVCPALEHTRCRLYTLWCLKTLYCPPLHNFILKIIGSSPEVQVKFILDSTAFPELIMLVQTYGQEMQDLVLYLTRTFAFSIHRDKQRLLGRWPVIHKTSVQRKLKVRQNLASIPRLSDIPDIDLTDKDRCLNKDHDNLCLVAGESNAVPSSPAARQEGGAAARQEGGAAARREGCTAARQQGGAAARPEVPGVPSSAACVYHTASNHTQYSVTSKTSLSTQQLLEYDGPPVIVNGEQGSNCVVTDDQQLLSLYRPSDVQPVHGDGPGLPGPSSEVVETSESSTTISVHLFQKCKGGMQQCSLSCGVQLGDRACGSGAVVRSSQLSSTNAISPETSPLQNDQFRS